MLNTSLVSPSSSTVTTTTIEKVEEDSDDDCMFIGEVKATPKPSIYAPLPGSVTFIKREEIQNVSDEELDWELDDGTTTPAKPPNPIDANTPRKARRTLFGTLTPVVASNTPVKKSDPEILIVSQSPIKTLQEVETEQIDALISVPEEHASPVPDEPVYPVPEEPMVIVPEEPVLTVLEGPVHPVPEEPMVIVPEGPEHRAIGTSSDTRSPVAIRPIEPSPVAAGPPPLQRIGLITPQKMKCEFCRKLYSKAGVRQHEKGCKAKSTVSNLVACNKCNWPYGQSVSIPHLQEHYAEDHDIHVTLWNK